MRNFSRRVTESGRLAAALVVALLAAQTITLQHELDPTPHSLDQHCAVHFTASVLGGANLGSFDLSLPVGHTRTETPRFAAPRLGRTCSPWQPRAPPLAS